MASQASRPLWPPRVIGREKWESMKFIEHQDKHLRSPHRYFGVEGFGNLKWFNEGQLKLMEINWKHWVKEMKSTLTRNKKIDMQDNSYI